MSTPVVFDLTSASLPSGRVVIEASAGTGKTFSLAGLATRFLAESDVTTSELVVVTFTNAAAVELRERIRDTLVIARRAIKSGVYPNGAEWLKVLVATVDPEVVLARLDRAISSFDEATISTIHGFCKQALRGIGQSSGFLVDAALEAAGTDVVRQVCRDLLVDRIASDPTSVSWTTSSKKLASPGWVLDTLIATVETRLNNPGAVVVPEPGARVGVLGADAATKNRFANWLQLVSDCESEVKRRRQAGRSITFDDLITGLQTAVRHSGVAAALRERFRLVMIDEFQDTDPVQWEIFQTLFADFESGETTLVTVGDPKQSIYRFRGADLGAYLEAVRGEEKLNLVTNYRSDASLIAAMNALFTDVEFGDPAIVGVDVTPRPDAPSQAVSPGAPLQIRVLKSDSDMNSKKGLSTGLARGAILRDLVDQVIDLLEKHTITDRDGERPVGPADIAVLTNNHVQAEAVARALRRARIPAVRSKSGSVFESRALRELRILLEAIANPSKAKLVRAAALGSFFGLSPVDVDPLADGADERLAEIQRTCAQWADEMSKRPFLGWYDLVRSRSGVVATLLAHDDGERVVTDLDHLAELLATDLAGSSPSPFAVLRSIDEMRADAAAGREASDAQRRRIETDADAVTITTVHASKALEYPIVLVPFIWNLSDGGNRPDVFVFNHPTDGRRHIDIASGFDWSYDDPVAAGTRSERKGLREVESRGDSFRLLYVALSRARHRTILWWAGVTRSPSQGVNVVLFDRNADGSPRNSDPVWFEGLKGPAKKALLDHEQVMSDLQPLLVRGQGAISLADFTSIRGDWPEWKGASKREIERPDLAVADPKGRRVRDRWWRRWSYSSIVDSAVPRRFPRPVSGGFDESDTSEQPIESPIEIADSSIPDTSHLRPPLADMTAGSQVGNYIHDVLEALDPTVVDLEAELVRVIEADPRSSRLGLDAVMLAAGLAASLRTRAGSVLGECRLSEIAVRDRLAEFEFDLPLGDLNSSSRRPTTRDIGRILLEHLPVDDSQRAYAKRLASGALMVEMAGFLQGSIDAVFRVGVGAEQRFVVVDYKSNRLHRPDAADPLAAYHPDLLPAEMASSHYTLQAVLYSVALHRFLSLRLPGYDPERHLGGVSYLFLRGMIGDETPRDEGRPYGVFSWPLPASAVVAIDDLFRHGVSR